MKNYRVYVEEYQHGKKVRENTIVCGVRGKNLSKEEIEKRLKNNIKTWQTACNKAYFKENHFTFNMVKYEEV